MDGNWKPAPQRRGKKRLLRTVQLLGFSGFVFGLVNNEVISHTGNRSGEAGEKLH